MNEIILRSATPPDVPMLFELITALAEYEKLSVSGSVELLEEHLFGDRPFAEAIVAECRGKTAGFALFFYNYSTFSTRPGIYLEDLFVLPEYRRRGIAQKLITYLAKLAVDRNLGHLEWTVLDWNSPAIAFYKRMGADVLDEWRICRVTGDSLSTLASIDN